MRTITCVICSKTHKMYAQNVERKLICPSKSGLVYKCKACNSTLNIIRLNGEWCARWIEVPYMGINDPIYSDDL